MASAGRALISAQSIVVLTCSEQPNYTDYLPTNFHHCSKGLIAGSREVVDLRERVFRFASFSDTAETGGSHSFHFGLRQLEV